MSQDTSPPIDVKIENIDQLHKAFMPFIRGGALFVPTKKVYKLGERVDFVLTLIDDPQPYKIPGSVVWITPAGAQGGKVAGIGLQILGEHADTVLKKINTHLAGLESNTGSWTM